MIRSSRCIACLVALGLTAGARGGEAEPVFELGLEAPSAVSGSPETVAGFEVTATLTTNGLSEGDPGAQGWSLSVAAEGCELVGATTEGTAGAEAGDDSPGLRVGGFEKTELVDPTLNDQGQGAVSAVVLSFQKPITLPPQGTSEILRLQGEVTIPAEDGGDTTIIMETSDGLQGSGQPVDNKVTFDGESFLPALDEALIGVQVAIDCRAEGVPVAVLWQDMPRGQAEGGVDVIRENSLDEKRLEVSGSPGEVAAGSAYVGIASQLESKAGVQGWSLAVGASDALTLTDATTQNTVGAEVGDKPPGLRSGGFEKTELVDPSLDDQGEGAVSAVVLSFTEPITLSPQGIATVLCLEFESTDNVPEEGQLAGELSFRDGLQGSGQPVSNVATVSGATTGFCAPDQQTLEVAFVPVQVASAIRSDANGDARVDIGDPIFLINALFRDGPQPACAPAADANEDGLTDLSDASFVIQFLFFGGSAPSQLECGPLPEATPENCPSGSTLCP